MKFIIPMNIDNMRTCQGKIIKKQFIPKHNSFCNHYAMI